MSQAFPESRAQLNNRLITNTILSMAKLYPIKTDLFRFVTFRGPEQLAYTDKNIRFVTHPDIGASRIRSCPVPTGESDKPFYEYIASFPSFPDIASLRKFNEHLFDLAFYAHKRKLSVIELERYRTVTEVDRDRMKIEPERDKTKNELEHDKVKTEFERDKVNEAGSLTKEQEIRLFDSLIGEVLSNRSREVRQGIAQMLVVNHALKHSRSLAALEISKLADIKIEIPYEVIACYKPWWYKRCGGSLEGIQSLGIADFRRVEQEVCCYVPGEVSHIENVMAREYKERSTRNLVRTENTIETSRETEIEKLTDVTTATRNELSSEIGQVLQEDKSANYGGSLGVSAQWGNATINVNAYADFATSNSSTYSNTEAKTYAEEITKRALERIVQRVSEKRTSKIIKEFEETNKHGFDNRNGDSHVTGVYRWLDIIYTNRLVNYGKRLMVEFMVPEPSKFYKRILKYKPTDQEAEDVTVPEAPKLLSSFGISKPGDINAQNALNAASYYGVTISTLPAGETTLTKDLSPLAPVDHNRNINTQSLAGIVVPANYEADKITGSYTYEYRAGSATSSQQAFCDFTFGGNTVSSGRHYSGSRKTETVNINLDLNPNLSGTIPVSVGYSGCFGFYGAVSIKCVLKASVISDWQTDAYNKMLAAYNSKLNEYNQAVEDSKQDEVQSGGDEEEKNTNPALHRIIEQRELKRICIEMLMTPYCRTQGQKHYTDVNACDLYQVPQVNKNKAFTEYASVVKFFEQAIDWQIMSYLFYPYYWADKCDWADLMQSESSDTVFQAFLQSGMARVVVPIRQQFTEAFALYLETGQIWLGNELVAGSQNNLYLSIAEELQTVEGAVEEEWETRVPTSLAIIQGKSAYLDQEGLPCCNDVENAETTSSLIASDKTLQIILPTE